VAVEVAVEQPRPVPRGRVRPDGLALACTVLLVVVAFLVLYPLLLLLAVNSFRVGEFGREAAWGLDNWRLALSQPRMRSALENTLTLALTRQAIATVIGILLAWLLARTNLPGRNWLELGFWFALLLPHLPVLMGWILLLDGHYGVLINTLRAIPLFAGLTFDLFSWWGIVVAHLVITLIPLKVFLLTPAFRNLDAALEEAAYVHGASTLRTLCQVVVPLLAPTILAITLLGLIRSIQSFEIELVLGGAAGIDIYSTLIYREVLQSPPRYGTATALSMFIVLGMIPLILLQQGIIHGRSYTTVSGKYTGHLYQLGPLRWPLFGLVVALLVFILIVPVAFMFLSSFMKVFGVFDVPDRWTTGHWERILSDPLLLRAIGNTLLLGAGTTVVSVVLFTVIAYVSVRVRFFGRRLLDFLTWLPSTVPGIVLSLGLLWLFLSTPLFRPLYGTIWILIIALSVSGMTLGVQLIRAGLLQLGAELEEAAWVAGGGRLYTLTRVLLPLIAPTIAVVALQSFATAVSAVSLIALLGSAHNKPLALLQLEYLDTGLFEPASVVGILIFGLTVGTALLARVIALRAGLGRVG
jgi:iron(III) transport system permease protein